jgi:DNA helicase II / ATP-dependent DNA helicase PcrA
MTYLDGLNSAQRDAVTAGTGPILVLAGPGSGKTRVLTHRIAYLIQEMGVPPDHILAVTFTNKAAEEMKQRVQRLLGSVQKGLRVGTFHSICAQLLRREHARIDYGADYVIYDTDDQLTLLTQAMAELDVDAKRYTPRSILNAISSAKNELVTADKFGADQVGGRLANPLTEVTRRVYQRYQRMLVDNNAMDFDDLLMNMVLLMRRDDEAREKYQRWFEHILVDEFQDTNTAQYQLVKLLAAPQNNAFVVGDEDQAIYAFRGADYRNVMQFRKDFPDAKVVLLEQNYRSTQIVLDVARAVIDRNVHRTPKALFTDKSGGQRVTIFEAFEETEEAAFVVQQVQNLRSRGKAEYSECAVMYRTNAQSRVLEEAFRKSGVPYKLVGGVGFYQRREVRDLLAYLRLINNPNDTVSFARIINTPKRGIGKKSVEDFQRWAADQGIGYGEALARIERGEATPLAGKGKAFADFSRQLNDWREIAATGDLVALFDDIRTRVGYTLYLSEFSEGDEDRRNREENVVELGNALADAQQNGKSLAEYLTDASLTADVNLRDPNANAVTLLTLHAAKGLEYRVVFLTGLEEDILPHTRARDDAEGMEEERRLFYVGVTRAEELLYITFAANRMLYGRRR